jgi:hypothetical protein
MLDGCKRLEVYKYSIAFAPRLIQWCFFSGVCIIGKRPKQFPVRNTTVQCS